MWQLIISKSNYFSNIISFLVAYLLGRVEVELYQYDFDIILKSLEIYKFVINQNILISAEKEFLKKKNFDVDFLFQVLQAIYNSNYDFEDKTNNIKRKNICWQIIIFDV